MSKYLFLFPVIAAIIGWVANAMLIRILFRSILPNRKAKIAAQIGKMVSREFSFKTFEDKIASQESVQKIMPLVEEHIDEFLRNKLSTAMPMLSMFIGDKTINQLKEVFMKELETLFPQLMKNYVANLEKDINIEKIVTEKIDSISIEKIEQTIILTLEKEIRLFKLYGAAIGLLIGLMQILVTLI